jgi:hypothetical protein
MTTMVPVCTFCDNDINEGDSHIYDERWYHELCWWKAECARLTGVIAEMKGEDDLGGTKSWQRNARHSFGSADTPITVIPAKP